MGSRVLSTLNWSSARQETEPPTIGVGALAAAVLPHLPMGLRKHARALIRLDWHLPRRFGVKATVAFYVATLLYGTIAGGHVGALLSNGTAIAGMSVAEVSITGQSETSEVDVLGQLGLDGTVSLATLDAADARDRVEALPWVATANIRKVYPDRLEVAITERTPYALWQHSGITSLIDSEGEVIVDAVDSRYARLPLIVGATANDRAVEVVALMAHEPELMPRIRAAVLVSERRWNLMLDNGVMVMLPETGAEEALATMAALDSEGLLTHDVTRVDLRLPDQVFVRLTTDATVELDAALRERTRLALRAVGTNA